MRASQCIVGRLMPSSGLRRPSLPCPRRRPETLSLGVRTGRSCPVRQQCCFALFKTESESPHLHLNIILPNLTISVARPKVRNASNREKMEVILVHVKSEFNSQFADNKIQGNFRALALSAEYNMVPMELHQAVIPTRCSLVPLICRTYCSSRPF
jgi:hypothetical protein